MAGLAEVYRRAMALQPVLKAMTQRGLRVNDALRRERIAKLSEEAARLQAAAQESLTPAVWDRLERPDLFWEEKRCNCCGGGTKQRQHCERCNGLPSLDKQSAKAAGFKSVKAMVESLLPCVTCSGTGKLYSIALNLGSDAQLRDLLYNGLGLPVRTKQGGKVTTDEEALQSLMALDSSGLVRLALRYAKLDTQRGIYERIAPAPDGHVRTVFNAAGTYTGRLSSAGAFYVPFSTGLHNLSASEAARDPLFAVRDAIIPDPNEVLIYSDLSQAEARITACLSEDHGLLQKWQDPKWDIHRWTASGVFSVAEDQITPSQRYLGKRVRHACVDALTEVLTPSGWISIAQLPAGRYVAQWARDGTITWTVPQVHEETHAGVLVVRDGRAVSQALTPDHRVPYITNKKLRVARADAVPSGGRLPLCGLFSGSVKVPRALMTLVAATQADGFYRSSNQIEFHLKKQRKIRRLAEALNKIGAQWTKSRREKSGAYRIVIRDAHTNECIRGWLAPDKTFDGRVLNLHSSALDVLLQEFSQWDGGNYSYTRYHKRVVYFTSIYENAVWVQTIAHLRGRQGLLRQTPAGGWTVSFNQRKYARLPLARTPLYKGPVWCLTVPTGFFLMRRNGRISVTGNCNYGMGSQKFWRVVNADADVTGIAITLAEAKRIHAAYHALHPNLDSVWWNRVERQLKEHGYIETVFGRRCHFYPRFDESGELDAETLRAAIAFEPQSTVADLKTVALLEAFAKEGQSFRCLHEAHDAILVGCREAAVQSTAIILKRCLERPLTINGIELVVPAEVFCCRKSWSQMERLL